MMLSVIFALLSFLVLTPCEVFADSCTNCSNFKFYTFNAIFSNSPVGLNQWSCQINDDCFNPHDHFAFNWIHNDSILLVNNPDGPSLSLPMNPPFHPNQTGTYTCQGLINGNICGNVTNYFYIIDATAINMPEHQYCYINESCTLECNSDTYTIDNTVWYYTNISNVSNIIDSPELFDDGTNYTCQVQVLDAKMNYTTIVHTLIRPIITSTPKHNELAHGPNVTNYTVTFISYSPGGPVVTWYNGDQPVSTASYTTSTIDATTGSTTLHISRRQDSGVYRVMIGSGFNGLPVPDDVLSEMESVDYSFEVNVIVYPAVPHIYEYTCTSFTCTVYWRHTNLSSDDAPDTIQLKLSDNKPVIVNGTITNYTFTNLIPATTYSLYITAINQDGIISSDQPITLTTYHSEPAIRYLTASRTEIYLFNVTINFYFLGASNLSQVDIGYRPLKGTVVGYEFLSTTLHIGTGLERNGLIYINDSRIANNVVELHAVAINNKNGRNFTSASESFVELGPPSQVSFIDLSYDWVTLSVLLPVNGTPPVISISFIFTSDRGTQTTTINGIYTLGELITLTIDGETGVVLNPGTLYNVTSVATNLLGRSNFTSPVVSFTTLSRGPLPSPTNEPDGTPIWVICLAGIIPAIACVLIVMATVCLTYLLCRKCKGSKKGLGYPITPTNGSGCNVNEDPYRIQKYFAYDSPLTPRPPTAEPMDITSFEKTSQLDADDSGSDTTQSLSGPKYKYIVSPTPSEVGIRAYVGSKPGSGSYVYV
jgi:hypothetical protein